MNRTKIEWTDYTWNPIVGCKHGCWYCYARKMTQRFKRIFPNGFEPTFYPERLKDPWELKKPSKIFVCSIADLFAPWTPMEWRDTVLDSIFRCPVKHIFQLLTKNPERIPDVHFPDNVWVGCTITNEKQDWKNLYEMLKVNAKVRFVSFEPLLGPFPSIFCLSQFDWIIIGKLTGSRRIKLDTYWVWSIMNEAQNHGIPIFLKNNLSPPWPKDQLIQEFPVVI